jgi:hypothetical protein
MHTRDTNGAGVIEPRGYVAMGRRVGATVTPVKNNIETREDVHNAGAFVWKEVLSDGPVGGFAVFTDNVTSTQQQQAVVPLQSLNSSSYLVWFDNTSGFSTAIAIANVSTQPANITMVIRS